MDVPDSLAHRIALFEETGRVFRKNEELFVENSWVQVMMGQGITPRAWHPMASKLTAEELDHFLGTIAGNVEQTLSRLPAHSDYVANYCGATDAKAA